MLTRVVICGSYHRDPDGLQRLFRELETTGCRILSPISIAFNNTVEPIVYASTEFDITVSELEKFHLRAIRDADFVWLHAPQGYVGISTAFELGFANALQIPVFCFSLPQDEMIATRVHVSTSVFEALSTIGITS